MVNLLRIYALAVFIAILHSPAGAAEPIAFVSALSGDASIGVAEQVARKADPGALVFPGETLSVSKGGRATLTMMNSKFESLDVASGSKWQAPESVTSESRWFKLPAKIVAMGGNYRGAGLRDFQMLPQWTAIDKAPLRLIWGDDLCGASNSTLAVLNAAGTEVTTMPNVDEVEILPDTIVGHGSEFTWQIACKGEVKASGKFDLLTPEKSLALASELAQMPEQLPSATRDYWKPIVLASFGLYQEALSDVDVRLEKKPKDKILQAWRQHLLALSKANGLGGN